MPSKPDILSFSRKSAYKLLYLQGVIILLVALIWMILQGFAAAGSAVLGGASWLLPSFYFIRKLFIMDEAQAQSPQKLAMRFFVGEIIKLFFSAVLVVLFIKLLPVVLLPFLSGYVGAVTVAWFMPYAYRNV